MNQEELLAAAPPSAVELFAEAVRHHQAGRLGEAEPLYRQVLAIDPKHAASLHCLGLLASQAGRNDIAAEMIGRAITLSPRNPFFHSNLGIVLKTQGRLAEAVECYERALTLKPDFADAHYNLGIALQILGRLAEAVECYERALILRPDYAETHFNLGTVFHNQGKLIEASVSYRRALAIKPTFAEAYNNLGIALQNLGRLAEAVESYRHALVLKPDFVDVYSNLGNVLKDQGKLDEAIEICRRALTIKPDYPAAHNNLGNALKEQGRFAEAAESYERALALNPDLAEIHNNLGVVLQAQEKFGEAAESYRRTLALKPDYAIAHSNLGNTRRAQGRLVEAVESYRRALAFQPDYAAAHSNLSITLQDQGRLAEAAECCRQALSLKPDFVEAHNNLLMTLQYSAEATNADLLADAERFAAQVEKPAARVFANDPNPGKRLRIGYVSGDFCSHSVGYFLVRVLSSHSPAAVETFCYSNSALSDRMTEFLRRASGHWRGLVGVSDEDAARQIREDGIDILVDLSGHTAKNRLPLFALRPAPVQVTWVGYSGTTGLTAIDYILADRCVVPEGEERYFTESVWRLPDCYLCYAPHEVAVTIAPPPMAANGFVTFGSFNNRAKITEPTMELWARVLLRVPGSRLFLKAKSLADAAVRRDLRDRFAVHGVAADRLLLETIRQTTEEALASYNRIDVALDPFPFGGCTTTAEALWMGVPVVTLRGDRWVGRASASILATIGLPELVAENEGGYVDIAAGLAADLPRLTGLRAGLRARFEASPFCDGPGFTRELEAAYRGMWQEWCETEPSS